MRSKKPLGESWGMGGKGWMVREVGKVSVAHENENEPRLVESVCVIVRRKRRIFFPQH